MFVCFFFFSSSFVIDEVYVSEQDLNEARLQYNEQTASAHHHHIYSICSGRIAVWSALVPFRLSKFVEILDRESIATPFIRQTTINISLLCSTPRF